MTGQHANRFQSFYHRPVLPFFWLGPFHPVATPRTLKSSQLHRQLAGQITVCGLPENLLKSKIEYVASVLFQTWLKNCHWNGVNEIRCRWQMKWQNNTSPWSLSPVVNPLSQCQFKSDRGEATWWPVVAFTLPHDISSHSIVDWCTVLSLIFNICKDFLLL